MKTRINWELSIGVFLLMFFTSLDYKNPRSFGVEDFLIIVAFMGISLILGVIFKCYK